MLRAWLRAPANHQAARSTHRQRVLRLLAAAVTSSRPRLLHHAQALPRCARLQQSPNAPTHPGIYPLRQPHILVCLFAPAHHQAAPAPSLRRRATPCAWRRTACSPAVAQPPSQATTTRDLQKASHPPPSRVVARRPCPRERNTSSAAASRASSASRRDPPRSTSGHASCAHASHARQPPPRPNSTFVRHQRFPARGAVAHAPPCPSRRPLRNPGFHSRIPRLRKKKSLHLIILLGKLQSPPGGSPATQYSTALRLGGLALDDAAKVAVAQAAGTFLVLSLKSENIETKDIALRVLTAITSCESSAKMLIDMGILPPVVEILFTTGSKQPLMRLRPFSATILANIISSGAEFESIVIHEGSSKTLISEDVIRNLLHLVSTISGANQVMGCKLLQILACLTKSRRSVEQVVDVIKRYEVTASLVDIMEVSAPDISSEAIKILRNISPFMAAELSTALYSSNAINKLIEIVLEGGEICEKQAVAVGLLANLPNNDLGLVQRLFDIETFMSILARLIEIHQRMIIGERASTYFEGLVRVLSKLTYMLQYEMSIKLAHDNKLAAIFADLLRTSGIDNVRVASAMALRNLSQRTSNLARNQVPASPDSTCVMCSCFRKEPVQAKRCEVHGEVCSLTATFCLVEGGVVETLVACLHNHNERVVEAALEALCTLLEDRVNVKEGALVIDRFNGVEQVTNILNSRRTGRIHQLAVWAIERLLRTQNIAQRVSANLNARKVLVDAFQQGDAETRSIAREALKWIDLLPPLSMVFKT